MKYNLILLMCMLFFLPLSAQDNSLKRTYVPSVFTTNKAPLYGLSVAEWSAFRYNRLENEWYAVPFQFDQLTEKGKFDKNSNGVTDASDELIFMPEDVGDKAEEWAWLDSDLERQNPRIELQLDDPLAPGETGWIYLYKNIEMPPLTDHYLRYSSGPAGAPAADTIKTDAFVLGHDKNGWIDFAAFSGGGDIIDRFKLRLAGKGFLIPAYEINEDFVEAETGDDVVFYESGPVRSFHETKAAILIEKLNLPLLPKKSDFKYNYQYTSHSFQITAETDIDAGLLALFGIRTMRQSLDFNENAVGMKIYSINNPVGLPVDGIQDAFDAAVNSDDSQNWVMASGHNGTVILIVDISLMKNSRRALYYNDDKSGASKPDGTNDTGDMKTFGDMGIVVTATGDALITDQLTVKFKGYFINEPNLDAEFGAQLMAWEKNPLQLTATEQSYVPSSVADAEDFAPDDFELAPAYPNPFSASSDGFIQFEILARKNAQFTLVVYNVLGRRVATIDHISARANERRVFEWNAIDQSGQPLPSGVYFYQMIGANFTQTHKLVISR